MWVVVQKKRNRRNVQMQVEGEKKLKTKTQGVGTKSMQVTFIACSLYSKQNIKYVPLYKSWNSPLIFLYVFSFSFISFHISTLSHTRFECSFWRALLDTFEYMHILESLCYVCVCVVHTENEWIAGICVCMCMCILSCVPVCSCMKAKLKLHAGQMT